MTGSLRIPLILCVILLLFSCATTGKPKSLIPPHTNGLVRNEALVFALRAAEKVEDKNFYLSLYDKIAGICIKNGLLEEATSVLGYAVEVLDRNREKVQFAEYSILFAKRYTDLRNYKAAETLLNRVLDHAEGISEEWRKRFLFEEIISIGLSAKDGYVGILRKVVDSILFLQDPGLKADLLSDTSGRFFRAGFVKDANDLIQLTLSVIGSLDSPWDKAEIFSRVAVYYRLIKDEPRLESSIKETMRLIGTARSASQTIPSTEAEEIKAARVAENLFSLNASAEALKVANDIRYPWILAETLCRLGLQKRSRGLSDAERDLVDRSFEVASSIADANKRLATQFRLELLLVESGEAREIQFHFAIREVELNLLSPGVEIDGFIFRLVHLYALTGDIESALRVSARIQDPFIRVSAFIDSARFALLNGKTSDGFDILDKSMNQAQNETRYRDRLYSDLSTAYLVGADLNRAVAAAGRIGAPYALGIAVAEVAAFTLSNRTILPEEALARLQTLFSK